LLNCKHDVPKGSFTVPQILDELLLLCDGLALLINDIVTLTLANKLQHAMGLGSRFGRSSGRTTAVPFGLVLSQLHAQTLVLGQQVCLQNAWHGFSQDKLHLRVL
jgi:hypothetical protein